MEKYTNYDIRKTIKKAVIAFVEIMIAGIIALEAKLPELVLVILPALEALRNWLKHKIGIKVL